MSLELFGIFPTPILKLNLGRDFLPEELKYARECQDCVVQPPYEVYLGNNGTVSKSILEHPSMTHLKVAIENCLDQWIKNVYAPVSPTKFKLKITQSWFNYTKPGESHDRHYHPNSIVSGTLYISANREYDKICFSLGKKSLFYIEPGEYNDFNAYEVNFPVHYGDIILFPSQLTHSVPKTTGEYTRVSLAFNSFFEGTIGTSKDIPNYIEINDVN